MYLIKQNCATVSIVFMWFVGLCYGFALMSAAAGDGGATEEQIFQPGVAWIYNYHTTVLLNEKGALKKDVGFFVAAEILVESVWSSSHIRLLKVTMKSPKLFIRTRKAPEPNGFSTHSSELENIPNAPFYILWNKGKVEKVLFKKDEPLSLTNIKKGLASLFQFQILDQEINETDTSGHCTVRYISLAPNKFSKTKHSCTSPEYAITKNPEPILNAEVTSTISAEYEFDEGIKYITSVQAEENHEMHVAAKEELGSKIETHQILKFVKQETTSLMSGSTFDEVLQKITDADGMYTQESLSTEKDLHDDTTKNFISAVSDHKDSLKAKHLGSLVPTKNFINLVSIGRRSPKKEIAKVLASKENKKILPQVLDILGYVQTLDSHNAVMKKLHFDDANKVDLSERYLWALSVSSQPNPEIILDLLNRYKKSINIQGKVKETLLLTIASMTNRLSKLSTQRVKDKVINTVVEALLNGLDAAKDGDRYVYLRALRNLKLNKIIPALLIITSKSDKPKECVLAWKALRAMGEADWSKEVLTKASHTFYERNRKEDSSSRTLAADVILHSNPNDDSLRDLLYYLKANDTAFEVRQYVLQQIRLLSEDDVNFRSRIANILKQDGKLNNYAVLALKGLSTALRRNFLRGSSSNGSLLTIQEMHGGIVRRGIVNVMMDKDGVSQEMFSLGVFSGGLGSFISSDSQGDADESATAGMELSILGTQIRPFTFFEGQGELMGHVWSGTASERTTAFQALIMLHDHSQFLRLGSGFIAELDLKGAASFDLAGKIEFSLWNRNAESLVEQSAGIVVIGSMRVQTSFVRSQVEFSVSMEPKLLLKTNIDFYSGVSLCMRLSQPDILLKHNIFKIERIPGSKHHLRKVKYKNYVVSGRTYALNRKNNEMCNIIFKNEIL